MIDAIAWINVAIGLLGLAGSIIGSFKEEWWYVGISVAVAVLSNILAFSLCSVG